MIIFNHDPAEKPYLPAIKYLGIQNAKTTPDFLGRETAQKIMGRYPDAKVYCTHPETIAATLGRPGTANDVGTTSGDNFVIGLPLQHYFSVAEGPWVHRRLIQKLHSPKLKLNLEFTPINICPPDELTKWLNDALFCAIDIETTTQNEISCISYTLYFPGGYTQSVVALPAGFVKAHELIHLHEGPKAFHNGLFDNLHLIRWGMPVRNWIIDTEYLWNAWQPQLPKSLASLSSYWLKPHSYWKDRRGSAGEELLEYAVEDTVRTAHIAAELLTQAPGWALAQAASKVSRAPALLAGMLEGFSVGPIRLGYARGDAVTTQKLKVFQLSEIAGLEVNPNSVKEMQWLLYDKLKVKPFTKNKKPHKRTDTEALEKICSVDAYSKKDAEGKIAASLLLDYKLIKKISQNFYEAKLYKGRMLYSLRVDKDPTDKVVSSPSSLWVRGVEGDTNEGDTNAGCDIQRAPSPLRCALVADQGWRLGSVGLAPWARSKVIAYLVDDPMIDRALAGSVEEVQAMSELLASCEDGNFSPEAKNYPGIEMWFKRTRQMIDELGLIRTPDGWRRIFHGQSAATYREAIRHQVERLLAQPINDTLAKLPVGEADFRFKAVIDGAIVFQVKEETFADRMSQLGVLLLESMLQDLTFGVEAKQGYSLGEMEPW